MDFSDISQANLDNADFLAQKTFLIQKIHEINANIKERDSMKNSKSSSPIEIIKIGNAINLKLEEILVSYDALINIYNKIVRSKKLRKKYTPEQLEDFTNTVKVLSNQVSECDAAIRNKSATVNKAELYNLKAMDLGSDREDTLNDNQQNEAREALQRWKKRDQQFDDQIRDIGEAVERIGDVALEIGGKSQANAQCAINISENVNTTTAGIGALSEQIKKIIKKQRKIECACRGVLIVIFMFLVTLLCILIKRLISIK